MSVHTFNYSLAQDVPQKIVDADNMIQEVHIHNHEHATSRDLYLGATSAVSSTNGHHILAEENIVFDLQPGDVLWGMTPTGSGCDVTVLVIRKNS
jgi:hypothetical protein